MLLDYSGLEIADYPLGATVSVFDRAGRGTQTSGWSAERFLVYTDYPGGFRLRQELWIDNERQELHETFEIRSTQLTRTVVLSRLYTTLGKGE